MRPVKELFIEEYWNIGYRFQQGEDTLLNPEKRCSFRVLKATKRYWYADPFLFEKDEKTFLFVEMFDNKTELGCIGCSEFRSGRFQRPTVVLREPFHLSYPFVFEEDGKIYMMPETSGDGCIQRYECVRFPDRWKKSDVLVPLPNAVDTVFVQEDLLTSVVDDTAQKTTHLELYRYRTGEKIHTQTAFESNQTSRGAGRVFRYCGDVIRPSQNCTGGEYGRGIFFNRIDRFGEAYSETLLFGITAEDIDAENMKPTGLHTYARNDTIEIVDLKASRLNFRRILWIIKKKLASITA